MPPADSTHLNLVLAQLLLLPRPQRPVQRSLGHAALLGTTAAAAAASARLLPVCRQLLLLRAAGPRRRGRGASCVKGRPVAKAT